MEPLPPHQRERRYGYIATCANAAADELRNAEIMAGQLGGEWLDVRARLCEAIAATHSALAIVGRITRQTETDTPTDTGDPTA